HLSFRAQRGICFFFTPKADSSSLRSSEQQDWLKRASTGNTRATRDFRGGAQPHGFAGESMRKFETTTEVDLVVVGAGGAGGVVAKELSTAGFSVVVLEQGPYLRERDFHHDELQFPDIYSVAPLGVPALANDYQRQPNTFRNTEKDRAK